MLDSNALTTVNALKDYLGITDDDIQEGFLSIYNSSGDATAATVQVTDTTIVLVVTGGVSAGTSTLTFADADKDTLSELVIAINALGKGWVANKLGNSSNNSTDLLIIAATGALLIANEQILNGVPNYKYEQMINRASDYIERETERTLKSTSHTDYYSTNDERFLFLKNFPVTVLTSVGYYNHSDAAISDALTEDDEYVADYEKGELRSKSLWNKGYRYVQVVYTAGYTTIPDDLELACLGLIDYYLNKAGKQGVESEKMGSYAIKFGSVKSIPDEVSAILFKYKRFCF